MEGFHLSRQGSGITNPLRNGRSRVPKGRPKAGPYTSPAHRAGSTTDNFPTKGQRSGPIPSIPHISLIKLNSIFPQKCAVFVHKIKFPVMMFLRFNVSAKCWNTIRCNRQGGVTSLPGKTFQPACLFLYPLGGCGLYLLDQITWGQRSVQTDCHMNMIHKTSNPIALTSDVPDNRCHVRMEVGSNFRDEAWTTLTG